MFFMVRVNVPGGEPTFVRVQAENEDEAVRKVISAQPFGATGTVVGQASSSNQLTRDLVANPPEGFQNQFTDFELQQQDRPTTPTGGGPPPNPPGPIGGPGTGENRTELPGGALGRQFEQLFPEQTIRSAISPNVSGSGGIFRRALAQRAGEVQNLLDVATDPRALATGANLGGISPVRSGVGRGDVQRAIEEDELQSILASVPNLVGQIGGGGAQGVGQTARELINQLAGVSERTNPLAGLSDPEQEILRRRLFQAAITGASPGGGFVASRLRGAFQPFQERFAQNLQTDLTQTGAGETFAQFLRRRILGG